jgi:hypothetical protein
MRRCRYWEDAMVLGTEGLSPEETARQLVNASWITHVVRAMAVLGLADQLANGPLTVVELAEATGTHAPALSRLLRVLVDLGVCARDEGDRVRLTEVGEFLRSDVPGSVWASVLAIHAPYIEQVWGELPEAVRTGEPVFSRVHGLGFWDYLTAHPEEGARFDAAMTGSSEKRARALLAARDLSGLGTLVDIGGGQGRLLAVALMATPGLRGMLFDRPEVLPGAEAFLASVGVRERCDLVGGDFFEAVPAGGDAYVLAQIVHDWPDEQAVAILRSCYQAMAPGARVWLMEQVIEPGGASAQANQLDLLMLISFGAQERTAEEYRALLEAAGFHDMMVYATPSPWSVVEAVRP